eukprot:g22089.t1
MREEEAIELGDVRTQVVGCAARFLLLLCSILQTAPLNILFSCRESLSMFLNFMGHLALQCELILGNTSLMDSLKAEQFDVVLIDAFNPCSFLVAEKLQARFLAVHSANFWSWYLAGLPSPMSYVPATRSLLSDQMGFWERLKNSAMFLGSWLTERMVYAQFDQTIRKCFPPGSQPTLSELYLKAELSIYNTDFTLDFARPLLPNVVYVGGLLSKPAKPLPQ